jgi:hypothetical protein
MGPAVRSHTTQNDSSNSIITGFVRFAAPLVRELAVRLMVCFVVCAKLILGKCAGVCLAGLQSRCLIRRWLLVRVVGWFVVGRFGKCGVPR